MKRWLAALLVVGLASGGVFLGVRGYRHYSNNRIVNVPVERNVATLNAVNEDLNANDNASQHQNVPNQPIPAELNLSAPFTTQAPLVNWDTEHEEFCEEATVLMAARALQGRPIKDPADAEQALQQLKAWELENLGYFESTTAEETARMVREFYGLAAVVVSNPSVTEIKQALANGNFVAIPAAGRELHNPNFKQPGPVYHMLLLKGFTKDGKWVTNDPGTRRGQNYVYTQSVLMNAIHDWNGGAVATGTPAVIIISGR